MLGSYLVEQGKIDNRQLDEILNSMDSVRVKLGLIAVSEGLMSQEQADEVNRLQSVMDKRFGDIAVEKGYLTDEQVGKLLKEQGNTYLAFAQTLVDAGIVRMDELEELLEQYKADKGYTNSELEAIKSDETDAIVPIMLLDEMDDLKELVGTAVRTIIRLIDRHTSIGKVIKVEDSVFANSAVQKMQGAGCDEICFMMEKDGGLVATASVFGKMDLEEVDEDALDAAAELVNCINGLYASAKSKQGVFLELMPPEYSMDGIQVSANRKYLVPVVVKGKELYLGVAKTV